MFALLFSGFGDKDFFIFSCYIKPAVLLVPKSLGDGVLLSRESFLSAALLTVSTRDVRKVPEGEILLDLNQRRFLTNEPLSTETTE